MSDLPVQLIVAAFDDEHAADAALNELKAAKREKLIGIEDAAVIRRDQNNKLHIKEVHDMGGGKGAGIGAVVGGVIGILAGPVVLAGVAGALIGGLAAKMRDGGFKNSRLERLGEGLKPGTSAIVAVVEHKWVGQLEEAMAEAGADVMTEQISADIAAQLQAGHEVAYSVLQTQDATSTSRVSAGEDQVELSELTVTEDGFVAAAAVATEEGVAGERVIVTDEGILHEVAAANDETIAYGAEAITDAGVTGAAVVASIGDESDGESDDDAASAEEEKKSDADGQA